MTSDAPVDAAPRPPLFSIITAVYDPPLDAFADTVASVRGQEHTDWEWVLVDDCSPDPQVRVRLARLAASDPRITVVERPENGGIVAASSDALAAARGEFVVLLDHDDVLDTRALGVVAERIAEHPGVDYLYSDQDRMTVEGETHSPFRKPDWSPERLRHHMYTTHLSVLRRELAVAVGGFRVGYDGSQDHDLVLRVTEGAREVVHVRDVLYHWREVPGSAAGDAAAKPWAWDAGVRAVQDHLDRVGIRARAAKGRVPGTYHVDREPDLVTPTSVVVATTGSTSTVRGAPRVTVGDAVRSLLATTGHRALEVVVVHDTATPASTLEELHALSTAETPVRLVAHPDSSHLSRTRNLGALHAVGTNLVFLDDDTETVSPGLPEHLTAPLPEPGVGATGAKLLFEDGSVQHAGLVYGSGTIGPYYHRAGADKLAPYGELWTNREVSALSGAALAVRRDVFEQVGGFSELFPGDYSDVDLSLAIRRTGRRLVWLHGVVLHHHGPIPLPDTVSATDRELISRRWGYDTEVPERYGTNPRAIRRLRRRSAGPGARGGRDAEA